MIILRQREYGNSYYDSQSGNYQGADVLIKNSVNEQGQNKLNGYREVNNLNKKVGKYKRTKSGGKISVSGEGNNHLLSIVYNKGLDEKGRKISRTFISDKSPAEAYRDFLRSEQSRDLLSDIHGDASSTVTRDEIKNAIRKNARKRAIISKAKKAAPWVIGGTLATGATIAGVKAYKKHKKDKKK
jgi:hypothetical protein